jgi:hypothetical protein
VRKLYCDACHKLAGMTDIVAAAREEEARCETSLVEVPAGDGPGDGRLARARQAAQPEDASLV